MFFISVDGGTTNTRLVLMKEDKVLADYRLSIGMRDNVIGDGSSYDNNLSNSIRQLLGENGLNEEDITAVVLSGMICSERGFYEVPHIEAPVSIRTLAESMRLLYFPKITSIPFYLIPGVKTSMSTNDLSRMDIMRGEETELFGMMAHLGITGNATFVLPGSHCKIIPVGEDGIIESFTTTISGELIRAAAEHTILKDSIHDAFPIELNTTCLLLGYDFAKEHGITEALFKVRILRKFKEYSPEALYAVLCGAILSEDIGVIERADHGQVFVGGSNPFRKAFTVLLEERTNCKVTAVADDLSRFAVSYGAGRLLKERQI